MYALHKFYDTGYHMTWVKKTYVYTIVQEQEQAPQNTILLFKIPFQTDNIKVSAVVILPAFATYR